MFPLIDLSWSAWTIVTLVLAQVSILCITLHLHRAQAHRALDLHPVVSHPMRLWIWLTTTMTTLEWVAVHRKHHATCETPDDPHSPKHFGLGTVLLKGSLLYARARADATVIERFGRGVPVDWLERNVYLKHKLLGPVLLVLGMTSLFGIGYGLATCTVLFLWSPIWAAGVINGLGHAKGYRNFSTPDDSRNLIPWGLWIGGEELHNNHHAHATSAKLSYHWWEVDIGWVAIRVLEIFGLAKVRKAVRPPKLLKQPVPCTAELLQLLASHQMLVSRWYQKAVVAALLDLRRRQELNRTQVRQLLRNWRESLMDIEALEGPARKEVDALHSHWAIWQSLWQDRMASREELTRRLTNWCATAEASGIASLQRMALKVRRIQTI